jgi:hypothetical protein
MSKPSRCTSFDGCQLGAYEGGVVRDSDRYGSQLDGQEIGQYRDRPDGRKHDRSSAGESADEFIEPIHYRAENYS